MEYRYGKNINYEDFSSGRVLYHGGGLTNFPVRLADEIFGRCREYLIKLTGKGEGISVYDPMCGGGYLLTVIGFLNADKISSLTGSDIDEKSAVTAEKNLALLSGDGMDVRISEIKRMYGEFQKPSYNDALISAEKMRSLIERSSIRTSVSVSDILSSDSISFDSPPDIIIIDVPYGNLVSWNGDSDSRYLKYEKGSIDIMLENLGEICGNSTVIAVCSDKNQKRKSEKFIRLEKQNIGKRYFEILRLKGD